MRHKRRIAGWALLAIVVAIAVGASAWRLEQADLRARLMRADPDAIPRDATLTRFALAEARPAYERNCAACHGTDLAGDRARGIPALDRKQRLYGEGRIVELERTILYGIRSGAPKSWNLADMPGFGRPAPYRRYALEPLAPGEIDDVVEFLLVTSKRPGDATAAARGAAIFAGKGQCFDCHEKDARGDAAIGAPDLVGETFLYGSGTRAELSAIVSRGAAGYCPAWFGRLSAVTIRALAVLVHEAATGKPGDG